jgi:hypothetical protein
VSRKGFNLLEMLIGVVTIMMIIAVAAPIICRKLGIEENKSIILNNGQYTIIIIDGCEYIQLQIGGTLTHKGNCTNYSGHLPK